MSSRRRNFGLRKLCECAPARWPKCPHPWHFSYKPRGGTRYRFSLDAEVGRHIEGKTEAERIANDFRTAINAGTFRRAADDRADQASRAQNDASKEVAEQASLPTLDQ